MTKRYPDFLSSEISGQTPEEAFFHIIPVPYERTVSYGVGTANGPGAILEASQQLESYDGLSSPCDEGIYTWDAVDCSEDDRDTIESIKESVKHVYSYGPKKIPIVLGGEHTVTNGPILALHEMGVEFGIVQFDAHADLRHSYNESIWSHACVMKRALDLGIPLCQLGVRAISLEEVETRLKNPSLISYIDGYELGTAGVPEGRLLPEFFPQNVYITIDVDGLDPSIISATGTPVPGGIGWYQMQEFLRKIAKERKIIGADLVELAPIEENKVSDFASARLVYDLMGIIQRSTIVPADCSKEIR